MCFAEFGKCSWAEKAEFFLFELTIELVTIELTIELKISPNCRPLDRPKQVSFSFLGFGI